MKLDPANVIDPSRLAELARALYPELAESNPAGAVMETLTLIAETVRLYLRPAANAMLNGAPAHAERVPIEQTLIETEAAPIETPQGLLKQLRAYRKRRNLSVNRLAGEMGINGPTLSTWLAGKYEPSRRFLPKIEKFLASEE